MTIFNFKPRSDAAVVRNFLPAIEAAQKSGASREALWQNLCDHHNLKLSFDAFCVALKRARAKEREKARDMASVPCPTLPERKAIHHHENVPETVDESPHQHALNMRKTEPNLERSPRKNRIKTSRDFANVHKLDFNEFDDTFK